MALMKLGETLGLSPNFQQLNMVKQELEKRGLFAKTFIPDDGETFSVEEK